MELRLGNKLNGQPAFDSYMSLSEKTAQNIPLGSYTGHMSPNEKKCLGNMLCYNLMLCLEGNDIKTNLNGLFRALAP